MLNSPIVIFLTGVILVLIIGYLTLCLLYLIYVFISMFKK